MKITKNWFLTSFLVYFYFKQKSRRVYIPTAKARLILKISIPSFHTDFIFSWNHPSYRDRTTNWLYELPAWLLKFLIQKNKKKNPLAHFFFCLLLLDFFSILCLPTMREQKMREDKKCAESENFVKIWKGYSILNKFY